MLNLPKDNPFLNLQARRLFFWYFLIYFILTLVFELSRVVLNFNSDDFITVEIFYCLNIGLLCLWTLQKCYNLNINYRYFIGTLPPGYSWFKLFCLVFSSASFSLGVLSLIIYLLSLLSPSFAESFLKYFEAEKPSNSFLPIISYLLYVINSVIVAPITEEFIFRGLILHRWATKWGIYRSILVSSLVFGSFHLDFLGASVFAIVMALLYIKYQTLIIPIVAHAMNNFIAIAIDIIPMEQNKSENTNFYDFLQFGLILTVIFAPSVIYFIYKNWNNRLILPYFANAKQS